ncbi:MAG: NAD(+)/NADH kinase, partial [Candidatus Caldarchaeum sp.]
MDSVLVVYAATRPPAVQAAKKLGKIFEGRNVKYEALSLAEFDKEYSRFNEGVIMVLGGDGTMLRVARRVESTDVKLIGVNYGRAGYLNIVEPAELEEACRRILEQDYHVERV